MAIHIYRPHRDALHLEAAHSFRLVTQALRSGDVEFFRGLRPPIEAVTRLLDDLGWGLHTNGRQLELTLPTEQLAVAVDFLDGRARPFAEARMSAPAAAVRRNDPILEHLTELLVTTERVIRS